MAILKVLAISFIAFGAAPAPIDAAEPTFDLVRVPSTQPNDRDVISIGAGRLPNEAEKVTRLSIPRIPADAVSLGIEWPDGSTNDRWSLAPQGDRDKFTIKCASDGAAATVRLSGQFTKDFGIVQLATVSLNRDASSLDFVWGDTTDERSHLARLVLGESRWTLKNADGKVVGRLAILHNVQNVSTAVGRSATNSDDPVQVSVQGIPKTGRGIRVSPLPIDTASGWAVSVEPGANFDRGGYEIVLHHRSLGAMRLIMTFPEEDVIELTFLNSTALSQLDKIAAAEADSSINGTGDDNSVRKQVVALERNIGTVQARIASYANMSSENETASTKARVEKLQELLAQYQQQRTELNAQLQAGMAQLELDPLTPLVLGIDYPITADQSERIATLNVTLVNRPGDRRKKPAVAIEESPVAPSAAAPASPVASAQNEVPSQAAPPAPTPANAKEIVIPATAGRGSIKVPIGALKAGQVLEFQYLRGEWSAFPRDPIGSPDDLVLKNENVMRVTISEGQGSSSRRIVDIPGGTASKPFLFRAEHDIPELFLNMDDNKPGNNKGEVVYKMWLKE